MTSRHFICFWLILFISGSYAVGQDIPHPVKNTGVYEFLDELANNQIISINSAVKPYTRLFIAKCLQEAEEKKDEMSQRQQRELEFYMMDFCKELIGERHNGTTAQRHNGARVLWYALEGGGDPPSPRLRRTKEGVK